MENLFEKIKRKLLFSKKRLSNLFDLKKITRTVLYHLYLYRILNIKVSGVHLGPGNVKIKNLLSIDAYPFANSDVIGNANNIKLANNSVGLIYNVHIMEHIPRHHLMLVLKEWYRVLSPAGILYISVPDMENLFNKYLENIKKYEVEENRRIADKIMRIIYGGQFNQYDYHYNGSSFASLKYLLEYVGFRNIKKFNPKQIQILEYYSGDTSYLDFSLNMQANK